MKNISYYSLNAGLIDTKTTSKKFLGLFGRYFKVACAVCLLALASTQGYGQTATIAGGGNTLTVCPGTANVIIYSFSLAQATTTSNIEGFHFTTTAGATTTTSGYYVYFAPSAGNSLTVLPSNAIYLDAINNTGVGTQTPPIITGSEYDQLVSGTTYYFYIVANILNTATAGATISITAPTTSNFSYSGTTDGAGTNTATSSTITVAASTASACACSQYYSYNGNPILTASGTVQTYSVPAGCTQLSVQVAGARGGDGHLSNVRSLGGNGGTVSSTITVSPSSTLYVYVGNVGSPAWDNDATTSGPGGSNSQGGAAGGNGSNFEGGGGGGESDIRTASGSGNLATRAIMGAGGGGGGYSGATNSTGGIGAYGSGAGGGLGLYGGSYTLTQDGAPGTLTCCAAAGSGATAGALGVGGNCGAFNDGGGGGGGYYGASGADLGGSCGGSSYALSISGAAVSGTTYADGNNPASGYVTITPAAPTAFAMTGGGPICSGGTGVTIGLANSVSGVIYQLQVGGVNTGSPVTGTGSAISFAPQTTVGTYTAVAYYSGNSGCTYNQTGSIITTVGVSPTISGSPSVCSGNTTALSASPSGGTWVSGTTSSATVNSSGVVTGLAPGATTSTITYTSTTGCPASVVVTVNTQPAPITGTTTVCGSLTASLFDVSTGGTWSSNNTTLATVGSTGVVTGGSTVTGNPVIIYTAPTGCISTVVMTVNALSAISGLPSICNGATAALTDAASGGVWSSSATSVATIGSTGIVTSQSIGTTTINYNIPSNGCTASLSFAVTGSPSVSTVSGGGAYCSGTTSTVTIGLLGSTAGVAYQLFNGSTPVGSVAIGSGLSLSFGAVSGAGTYGVIADYGTACATIQSGTATISITPLPTPFTLSASGGGAYCSGSTAPSILLSSSVIGTNYQLVNSSGAPIGSTVAGTSGSINFGTVSAAGVYSVTATNMSTSCVGPMANTVTITVNVPPTAYNVTAGGSSSASYCLGGTDTAHVRLTGSATGTTYQLYVNGISTGSAVAGTGGVLDFGVQATAGVYTVVATTTATGCTANMLSSATMVVNALPAVYNVTGGGTYCSGTAAPHVGLNGSAVGINYQLYYTPSGGVTVTVGIPASGTGSPIDFGAQTLAGGYTVTATNTVTGCSINMFGSVPVIINPLPTNYTVTSSAPGYCAGGTGVHIYLSSSVVGITYTLMNGTTPGTVMAGTGSLIDFGLQTPTASSTTYTVQALNTATGCTNTTTSSVTITMYPLPIAYAVTGGGSYCFGTTPGRVVGLGGSTSGNSYQLYVGGVAIGSAVAGGGGTISFPSTTTVGSYTVIATTSFGCAGNMTGSVPVSTTPLPIIYNVTGGGGYCAGATSTVTVGLSGSDVGINYQLVKSPSTNAGAPLAGIGGPINFGADTAGTYTVTAINTTTGCTSTMFGNAAIFINPLPSVNAISASGSYCAGGSGYPVTLSNSTVGVNYQLLNGGAAIGGPVAGTGALLSFGNQTAAGNYTIVASNASTSCTSNMSGTATITISPLPTVYTVTSIGTSYCAGGTGVTLGLSASTALVSYQLYNGLATAGTAVTGTGAAITFGLHTAGVYTVIASNGICNNTMAGTITVTINPLPSLYTISGGGSYCSGGTGVSVGLSGSATGINYQLWVSSSPIGVPFAGTGSALNFGLQTTAGSYTVIATNTTTGCTATMTGTASVVINSLPVPETVMGGGNYCPGGMGVDISLSGSSASTVLYQLYDGSLASGIAMPGTGAAIDFGDETATGTYTVIATNTLTGCTNTMIGSATIGLYPVPVVYSVTGGGNYCPGSAGANVGLSGSTTGIYYTLYNGIVPVYGPIAGTGLPLNFGAYTTGTYTVVAMNSTSCTSNMSGSVTIGTFALPTTYNVTGGGNYCAGGSGEDISLDGSAVGNTYQLVNGITPVGTPMAGTGFALDFGLQTAAGTYTIVATSGSTTCTNTMTGSATIVVNPLPTASSITGGGNYCAGSGGVNVGLTSSQEGVNYQLFNGTASAGGVVPGTGFAISFGLATAAGTYTVMATNTVTGCTSTMPGSAVVVVYPTPTAFTVTGGGNYCPSGAGEPVSISGSTMGVTYQLMNGTSTVGAPVAGTGFAINFGLQTAPGVYSVAATNLATSCTNTMSGTVTIGINSAPAVYSVSSSASQYCVGGPGVSLLLSGSDVGVNYQLYAGTTPEGSPVAGTGLEVSFGLETAAGTYTVVATNAAGCVSNMASSATVVINSLPTPYSVVGGGNYCPGGAGVHIGLTGSHNGASYQLYIGTVATGTAVSGTGFAIDFGLQTTPGTYTIVATDPVTTCVNTMAGSATIGINTVPTAYTVTGGGSYCAMGDGVGVGLSGSATGVVYQLSNSGSSVGSGVPGTGSSINFGLQTSTGSYTVTAMSTATGCTNAMAGSVPVIINSLPTAYAVSGGGNYCPGGSGVHVGLVNSVVGVNYQLYNGALGVGLPVAGTGIVIDFGLQTAPGTYTIVATNLTTGCSNHMSGGAVVVVNTLPATYAVIGGGNYCSGGTGVNIGLASSAAGVNYSLFDGSTPEGLAITGTGGPIDFGPQTATGTYTVAATNVTTGCTANMAGTAAITVSPVVTPSITLATTSGDTSCTGTAITINAIVANGGLTPTYSWNVNGTPAAAAGSSYTYTPANGDIVSVTLTSSATCATPAVVNNSLSLVVIPHGTPSISISANANPVCAGTSITFTPVTDFGGSVPLISWIVNGHNLSSAAIYSYIPGNGDEIYAALTSDYYCRLETTVNSNMVTMEVDASVTPAVSIIANPGTNVVPGQLILLTATIVNSVTSPSYQWLLNGEPIVGATTSEYTATNYSDLDSFSCVVTSGGGCAGMSGAGGVTIHVSTNAGVSQVNATNSDIKLVPNPNNGVFTIKGTLGTTGDEEVSIEVTDMLGQVIYTDKVMTIGGNINQRIQLAGSIANGMYILNIRSASANNVFHVVIEQ